MDQTVEKTIDRLSELLDRATKTAQDLEVKDRLTDAVSALRRTRITQDDDAGVEGSCSALPSASGWRCCSPPSPARRCATT